MKYVNYSMWNVNRELRVNCPLFSSYIEDEIVNYPDTPSETSCSEVMHKDSGVYSLKSKRANSLSTFLVYCLEDDEGGDSWTLIQRRVENDIVFNKTWSEYENGFGNVYGSYWMGLKEIYAMTNDLSFELWILLRDFDNATHYAKYDEFVLGNVTSGYTLIHLGQYSGEAGNSLKGNIGQKFSAYDNVNIGNKICPVNNKGGWWFSNCGQSNLNGEYYDAVQPSEKEKGIYWNGWRGLQYSYKYAHMAIRQKTSGKC